MQDAAFSPRSEMHGYIIRNISAKSTLARIRTQNYRQISTKGRRNTITEIHKLISISTITPEIEVVKPVTCSRALFHLSAGAHCQRGSRQRRAPQLLHIKAKMQDATNTKSKLQKWSHRISSRPTHAASLMTSYLRAAADPGAPEKIPMGPIANTILGRQNNPQRHDKHLSIGCSIQAHDDCRWEYQSRV